MLCRRFKGFLRRGAIAATFVVMLIPSAAQAACEWNLKGIWNFYQDNGITATFEIEQLGRHLTGNGKYALKGEGGAYGAEMKGTIDGTIEGSHFSFTTKWNSGPVGVYEGQIGDQGQMSGTTSGVRWHEYYGKKAPCMTTAAAKCPSGQVWRESFEGDSVCVTPDARFRLENGTCRSGYVWRDSFNGDNVCVTPQQRAEAKAGKIKR